MCSTERKGMHNPTDVSCPGRGKKNGQAYEYVCKPERWVVGRQTVKHTDGWADRPSDRQPDRQSEYCQTQGQTHRHSDRHTDRRMDKQRDILRRAQRLVGKQTEQKQKSGSAKSAYETNDAALSSCLEG